MDVPRGAALSTIQAKPGRAPKKQFMT